MKSGTFGKKFSKLCQIRRHICIVSELCAFLVLSNITWNSPNNTPWVFLSRYNYCFLVKPILKINCKFVKYLAMNLYFLTYQQLHIYKMHFPCLSLGFEMWLWRGLMWEDIFEIVSNSATYLYRIKIMCSSRLSY